MNTQIEKNARAKYLKRKIDLTAPQVADKKIAKSFEEFLRTVQKSNCLMWSLHGLSVFDIFIADRDKFPSKSGEKVSAAIMKLMRAITEYRPTSICFQMTQLMTIDMNRCVLIDES